MARAITSISGGRDDMEILESLKLDYDEDLSKVIIALSKYAKRRQKDKEFKKEIEDLLHHG